MSKPPPSPPSGWYDDPNDPSKTRWWDGVAWTEATLQKVAANATPPAGAGEEPPSSSAGSVAPETPATQPVASPPDELAEIPAKIEKPRGVPVADPAAGRGKQPDEAERDESGRSSYAKQLKFYAAGCVALIVFLAIVTSGGSDGSSDPAVSAESPAVKTPVELTITRPSDGSTVKTKVVRLKGTVSPGGNVVISPENGGSYGANVETDGSWTATQSLAVGQTYLAVEASLPGRSNVRETVRITRQRSQAEIAAARRKRAAAKQKKADAKAAFEANFKKSAKSLSYKQLEKGADNYSGERVVFRGQVFQIQESGGYGYMLLSVTDLGYDIWTDNVWVNFDRSTSFVEDDIVTVWGRIVGSKSYETQIGGETFVPEMDAKYLSAG